MNNMKSTKSMGYSRVKVRSMTFVVSGFGGNFGIFFEGGANYAYGISVLPVSFFLCKTNTSPEECLWGLRELTRKTSAVYVLHYDCF